MDLATEMYSASTAADEESLTVVGVAVEAEKSRFRTARRAGASAGEAITASWVGEMTRRSEMLA